MTELASPKGKAAGAAAITVTTVAVACGVCCVLPLALPAVLLGSIGGMLAWLSHGYVWLTTISVLAVAAGWGRVIRQTSGTGRRPARGTVAAIGLATIAMVVALIWHGFTPMVG